MNKKKEKILILIAVLTLMFSLTACGGGGGGAENGGESEDVNLSVMEDAVAKLDAIKSMTYDMTMDMEMIFGGETIAVVTTGSGKIINDPLTMEMTTNMDSGMGAAMDMGMYVETVDGKTTSYTSAMGSWFKQEIGDMSQISQYDASESMDLYLSSVSSFKEAGEEEINGSMATKYEGVITEESFNKILDASGTLDQLNMADMDEETLKNMYSGIGDLPISIWIDKKTSLPVRYDMDMTNMIQAMMINMASQDTEGADVTITKAKNSMTITGYDNVDSITIPEEARNAESLQ